MKQPEFVEFQDQQSVLPPSTQLDSSINFSEFGQPAQIQINLEAKKSHAMKKTKLVQEHEEHILQQIKDFKEVCQFGLAIPLINMLRNPQISQHEYDDKFLQQFQSCLKALNISTYEYQLHAVYLHIIFAQIENLQELHQELGFDDKIQQLNTSIWNSTNIINAHCLLANLNKIRKDQQQPSSSSQSKTISLTKFRVNIVTESNQCLLHNNILMISKNLIDIAIGSHGHWDIYFAPFLLEKLHIGTIYRILHLDQQNSSSFFQNYSAIFTQLATQYSNSMNVIDQKWYQTQLQKLTKDNFSMDQIENLIRAGVRHTELERLLIGLLGWKDQAERAVKLLNCYYNRNDWQINDSSKPTICQCEENFTINYLIENSKHREKIIICLSAPCFNSSYNDYCFSFHKPTLNQYVADNVSYLWIQNPFGKFKKSGFYDWILYFANAQGKQTIIKIIDIKENKKLGSQFFNKKYLNLGNVKGRYIIHPQYSRQTQIHQVFIDSISSDQGIYKAPHFSDAIRQVQILKKNGVNTIYFSGVFERDNRQFQQGYKRPEASSVAFTNRSKPNSMMGGQKEFIKLIQCAKQNNIKVILDAFTRVSSSHMSRKYQGLRLACIDEHGRKNFLYGSEGRSINYEETTILNYRKKQAWDLLQQQILQIIEKYQIDGIHLDNGQVCPQMYEIDRQEIERKQNGQYIYSNEQIFEGHIVNPKKKAGYWTTDSSYNYPNPFLVYLCHKIWTKYPNFIFISESYQAQNSIRFVKVIESGFIPRLFKLPKALSQITGTHIHQNGSLSATTPKAVIKLAKWYEQTKRILPKNSILIQSTCNHIYPYPSLVLKKATWAFIDLFFFLPDIPMTFSKEHMGRAYRTKSLNFYVNNISGSETRHEASKIAGQSFNQLNSQQIMKRSTSYSMANSNFFQQQSLSQPNHSISRKQKLLTYSNSTVRDPSQVKHLQESFRKEVGPQFGFDLGEIHKHYQHRRQLRQKLPLLVNYRMILLTAEHLYGIHTNVISFAKYGQDQILLISTNFNETAVDMHYNLAPLKVLFKDPANSDIVIKIQDVLNPAKFSQEYYTVGEILSSKIQEHIKAYNSSIWRLHIDRGEELLQKAFKCSEQRIRDKVCLKPAKWIYSSVFTNELDKLVQKSKTLKPFVKGLNKLYEQFILPNKLDFSLVISKTHQFYTQKVKLQKLFGILKLLQNNQNKPHFQQFQPMLKAQVQKLLKGNELGPIAFITPEIGPWSTVGGLGVMVDQLSKELVKIGQTVYIITPYYQYNKKRQTNYLAKDGFQYQKNITTQAAHITHEFGIHRGIYHGVHYIWCHNPELFSRPYDGQGAEFVTKQLVFFALMALESFCQLQIYPSIIVTNDWMCGFVSAYVKVNKYKDVFNGSKFIHICHNLGDLYEGKLYPKSEQGDFNWLVQLPRQWYLQYKDNKLIINPSMCALQTCDNWGTVSNSYKIDLLRESTLAPILWKHPHPFSFPNGVRKDERLSIINAKTPGNHLESKALLQKKYFGLEKVNDSLPLLAFIGRVTKQKGVHLIVDAVQDILYETQFKVQFLIGGPCDSKQDYGKYCAQKMKYLTHKYPQCVWSSPHSFFTDGSLVNIGSDFAMMPSQFEPGGIVQHEFFSGSTPVIAFRTGGLKDTVFEYDIKTKKGNGFNFLTHDVEDFKRCLRRAISCYHNKEAYAKLRENAFDSVVEESDVARGWNSQFYRMQNKIYIDWDRVEEQIKTFTQKQQDLKQDQGTVEVLTYNKGEYWRKDWEIKKGFKEVLKGASRLQGKSHAFCFQTDKIPRPKQVLICGTWNDWKQHAKMNFDKIHKNWKLSLKLKPGNYSYKYMVDGQWNLTKNQQIETDLNNIQNHIVIIE